MLNKCFRAKQYDNFYFLKTSLRNNNIKYNAFFNYLHVLVNISKNQQANYITGIAQTFNIQDFQNRRKNFRIIMFKNTKLSTNNTNINQYESILKLP